MRQDVKQKLQSTTKDGIKIANGESPAMLSQQLITNSHKPLVIRLCLSCDKIVEAECDPQRCPHCTKSFLPINYMSNVEPINAKDFAALFSNGTDLKDEDLIRGLFVIW